MSSLLQMCLNRQCQNVSVFGVHECSAKCTGRGVSTAAFWMFFQCYDALMWKLSILKPVPRRTEAHFSCSMLKMPSVWWAGSHYNALQSIILDAERFNQSLIIASFMLRFKRNSSCSQAAVLVPKTVQKSEGPGFIRPNAWSSDTQFDFETESMDIGFFLNVSHQTSMGGPVWDEICGFVILHSNSLAGPGSFDCDSFKLLPHQSCRGSRFYCLLNETSPVVMC